LFDGLVRRLNGVACHIALDLHGSFATRGDAFKRLALVASALESPVPAFNAEEWETANLSRCGAINAKAEAATKRFVSLLQAEMSGTLSSLMLTCDTV
jgi:hypothetical protein